MRNLSLYIIIAVWFGCAMLFSSCSNASDVPNEESEQGITMLSLVVRGVPTVGNNSSGDGYDEGSVSDSYIDFYGHDYRMLFFDIDDKYIGKCSETVASRNATENTEFELIGVVPDVMLDKKEFKIVVLANWGTYNEEELKKGITTISDLCNASWSQFTCNANTTKEIIKGTTGIPFFGVRKFSNVTFTKRKKTTLTEPVTLLRAMAKVEVLKKNCDESNSYDITSVTLTNYNTTGYCAPLVTERSDYDHDYTWSEDFVKALHLVSNSESTGSLDFTEDNGKWILYIPEYQNLTEDGSTVRSDGKEAIIKVKFDFQLDKESPYELHIAKYTNNEVSEYLNIERNNLYRYTLNFATHKLNVVTGEWTDVYDNSIEFKNKTD